MVVNLSLQEETIAQVIGEGMNCSISSARGNPVAD